MQFIFLTMFNNVKKERISINYRELEIELINHIVFYVKKKEIN